MPDTIGSNPASGTAQVMTLDEKSFELSSRRTGLSFQRTRMSADRTLMAVMRTSLSLISFGFTIYQIFQKLHDAKVIAASESSRNFGSILVFLGIAMLVFGIIYHVLFMVALRREREEMHALGLIHAQSAFPISLSLVTAVLVLALGVVAIFSMLTGLGPLG